MQYNFDFVVKNANVHNDAKLKSAVTLSTDFQIKNQTQNPQKQWEEQQKMS